MRDIPVIRASSALPPRPHAFASAATSARLAKRSVGPNLKHEYEVQYNAGSGQHALRVRAAAEFSFGSIGHVTHRRPNPSFKRTATGVPASAA